MSFEIKRGTDRPSISTTLTDGNGIAIDITNANDVLFRMRSEEGVTIVDADLSGRVNIINAEIGQVEYVFDTDDLSDVGKYYAEFEVEYDDGGVEAFPSKGYNIVEVTEGTA